MVTSQMFGQPVGRLLVLALTLLLVATTAAKASWAIGLISGSTGQATAGAAPATPSGVASACTSANKTTVNVTWTAVAKASSYTIWTSTTSATSGFSVTASGVTGTTWTSGNLSSGSYWFEVSAVIGTNWTSPNSSATAKRTITTAPKTCS